MLKGLNGLNDEEFKMQIAVDISTKDIINAVKEMELDDLEELKTALIEREIYFKKFKKDKIENIIQDFKSEGYSEGFLKDLENGLKKSSVYNGN
jgi:Cdc6-like AAA superfamily ATPase